MKQILFEDIENQETHAGILLDDGSCVCGCCGGLFPADEHKETWNIIKEYDEWIDIQDAIAGDDTIFGEG